MLISVYSENICVMLFGEVWRNSGFYLSNLIWAGLFLIQETLIRNFIKALCAVKSLFKVTILKRILGIILIFMALRIRPKWMLYGYIISTIIGLILNTSLYSKLIRVKMRQQFLSLFKAALPSIFFFVAASFIKLSFSSIFFSLMLNGMMLLMYYGALWVSKKR